MSIRAFITFAKRDAASQLRLMARALCLLLLSAIGFSSCERNPPLYLHHDNHIDVELPIVELKLDVYWDYIYNMGIDYDWRSEWYYGWDAEDTRIHGPLEYVEPKSFFLRRYYLYNNPDTIHTEVSSDYLNTNFYSGEFRFGFWDILAWNDIETLDGVQSLHFDETTTLEYVTASTNMTTHSTRYNAPRYTRSFYQPEQLFSAYVEQEEVNENLEGFVWDEDRKVWVRELEATLEPRTYIYLIQLILHNNRGRVSGTGGEANLSGMARSTNLNSGIAGTDAITVYYTSRMKEHMDMDGEDVDIIGGRLMTFGLCGLNPNRIAPTRASGAPTRANDRQLHYTDFNLVFNNGMDSTLVFDVTEQVAYRYRGGVITVELDMDTVPIPSRSGGSGFDATVVDFEEVTFPDFEM